MNALLSDDSPRALANALTTYNIVVEGVLAETGYHYYRQIAEMQGIFPGLLEGIRLIARDESRLLARRRALISLNKWSRTPSTRSAPSAAAARSFGISSGRCWPACSMCG